jgi:hypothetical protein
MDQSMVEVESQRHVPAVQGEEWNDVREFEEMGSAHLGRRMTRTRFGEMKVE